MRNLGFKQCPADSCVLRSMETGNFSLMVVIHVDDILVVGNKQRCDKLCFDLNRSVSINNLGQLSWYTGCSFIRDRSRGPLTISQQALVEYMLERFDVRTDKNILASPSVKLDEFDPNESGDNWPFREAVGSLMWVANQT